jgi:hypothetical protein
MDFKIGEVVRKRSNKPFKDCSKTALVVGFSNSPNPKGGVGLVLENNTVVDSRMLVKDESLTNLVRKIKETVAKAEENDCDEFSTDYINNMMLFSVSWTLGGSYGRSCWDEFGEDIAIKPQDEPDFYQLTAVLDALCHPLNKTSYDKLVNEVVVYSEYSDDDWYGNYQETAVKSTNVKDLAVYLVKNVLLKIR